MQLPDKTFLAKPCELAESDFEFNGQVKLFRIMQLLQNVATEHAKTIGMGWDALDNLGILWVLSKMKINFYREITMENGRFTLYTWPLAPHGLFVERCFSAVDENGNELFAATSLWLIISKKERKIMPANITNDLYSGKYSQIHCSVVNNFRRIRKDDSYEFSYETQMRRSELDKNGHVNNTNYITFALDALRPEERVSSVEIVYNKELKIGEKLRVYAKREADVIYVTGESAEINFTAILTLE